MKLRVCILGLLLATLALFVPKSSAQDGLRGALSQMGQAQPGAGGFSRALAAADFDNDSRPDGAVISQAGWLDGQRCFRIDLHVTAGKDISFTFPSAEPDLDISAVDVNRDGAADIVVERPFSHQRVQVYLNDGHGAFQKVESNSFFVPDDSGPLWRVVMDPLNFSMALLPATRGFEFASVKGCALAYGDDAGAANFWPKVLLTQCGARGPSSSRAPPSLLSL
jgi:hypothetical protein